MQLRNIFFILGLLTVCLALFLIFPGIVSFFYEENATLILFLKCFAGTLSGGIFLALVSKPPKGEKILLTPRDGVAIVGLCWIFAAFICALPYFFITEVSFAKSLFESASGLSTTGGTIFSDVEILPKGILFWRSFTQWIGAWVLLFFLLPCFQSSVQAAYSCIKRKPQASAKIKLPPE